MSKQKISFEEHIRETMDGFEEPYKEGSWEALQSAMGTSSGSAGTSSVALVAAFAAAFVAAVGTWFLYTQQVAVEASDANFNTLIIEREGNLGFDWKAQAYLEIADKEYLTTTSDSPYDTNSASEGNKNSDSTTSFNEEHLATNSADKAEEKSNDRETVNESNLASKDAEAKENERRQNIVEFPSYGDIPAIPIEISTREACEGATVTFNIDASIVDGNYLWNFGDGSFSNQPNPEHTYHKSGTYDITLSITSNKDGVIRTNTMDQLIIINPNPEADFDWEFVDSKRGQPVVRFNNKSKRANQAQWVIVDSVSEEINPVHLITSKGAHDIELFVSNEHGCQSRTTKKVSINEDYALQAPTRFSPNNDGLFDTFMPKALMTGEHSFEMTIKRGDEIIYETSDPMEPWTGELPDGTMAETGSTFTWMAIVHKRNGEKYYSGNVAVIR